MNTELAELIIDRKIVFTQPRTCEGCKYHKNSHCALYSGFCLNSIYRPYYELVLLQQQEELWKK